MYVNQVGGNDSLVFDGGSVSRPAGRSESPPWPAHLKKTWFSIRYGDELTARIASSASQTELELVHKALTCGTRDYVRKSGFRAVVVGLSGGIDSSVVAAIAVAALGRENVLGVSMPGPYSSEGSRADARQLAR